MQRMGSLFAIWLAVFAIGCASAESSEDPSFIDDDDGVDGRRDGGTDDGAAGDSGNGDASKPDGSSDASPDAAKSCVGIVCDKAPASVCDDASTVRIYEDEGTCTAGVCEYPSTTVDCPYGCAAGACEANPCEGVVCNGPPANECVDATTIKVYSPVGTCGKLGCKYADQIKACPHGCKDGACKDDPCANITCNSPDANKCISDSYLRSYHATGTCAAGECVYGYDDKHCNFGCKDDVCNGDPCLGKKCETAPANFCEDSFTLVVYASKGTCNAGLCSHSKHTEFCTYGCDDEQGKCKGNPCLGVKCETPTADYCKDAGTLIKHAPTGTCSIEAGGDCSYESEEIECPCANGVCKDCLVDADCDAGKFCYDFSCRPCQVDNACGASCTDCTASGDVCDANAGSCVGCVVDGHCGPGAKCENQTCESCESADACGPSCAPCGGATPFCSGKGIAGQCVECLSDGDCTGGRTCNPSTHTCENSAACRSALTAAGNALATGTWVHAKMDGVGSGWPWDFWEKGKVTWGPTADRNGNTDFTCWATKVSNNYINCQRADLRTPQLNVAACVDEDIKLVFWHWFDFWTDTWAGVKRYDGGLVELSGNNGSTWVAANVSYPGMININASMDSYACTTGASAFHVHNKPGYVGKSGGWQKVEVVVPKALRTSQLRMRFAYGTGVSGKNTSQTPSTSRAAPGWYIDAAVSIEAQ